MPALRRPCVRHQSAHFTPAGPGEAASVVDAPSQNRAESRAIPASRSGQPEPRASQLRTGWEGAGAPVHEPHGALVLRHLLRTPLLDRKQREELQPEGRTSLL